MCQGQVTSNYMGLIGLMVDGHPTLDPTDGEGKRPASLSGELNGSDRPKPHFMDVMSESEAKVANLLRFSALF